MASRKQIAAARRNIKKARAALKRGKTRRPRVAAKGVRVTTLRQEYRAAKARYHTIGAQLGTETGVHHARGKKSRKRKKTGHKKSR